MKFRVYSNGFYAGKLFVSAKHGHYFISRHHSHIHAPFGIVKHVHDMPGLALIRTA